jgi:hypothetical protein
MLWAVKHPDSRAKGEENHPLPTHLEMVERILCKRKGEDPDTPSFRGIVTLSLYTAKRRLSLIYGYACQT